MSISRVGVLLTSLVRGLVLRTRRCYSFLTLLHIREVTMDCTDSGNNDGSASGADPLDAGHGTEETLNVLSKVQNPPAGNISKGDLKWELRNTHERRLKDSSKSNTVVVEQCFIETSRVQDFIQGMENSSGGVSCRYIKIRTKPCQRDVDFKATETTPLEVTRYHCQFGPQDHTKLVKTVTPLLMPRHRSKIMVAGAALTKRTKKKTTCPVNASTAEAEPDVAGGASTKVTKRSRKKTQPIGEASMTVNDEATVAAAPAKRRGRPRKQKDIAEASADPLQRTDVAGTQNTGRPRPKKSIPVDAAVSTDRTVTVAPKPARRPPKKILHCGEEVLKTVPGGTARRRGRPRKQISEGDADNAPRRRVGKKKRDDVPQTLQKSETLGVKGTSELVVEAGVQLEALILDLNFPPDDCNNEHSETPAASVKPYCVPAATCFFTATRPQRVQCKRPHPRKRPVKNVQGPVVALDLNAMPAADDDGETSAAIGTEDNVSSPAVSYIDLTVSPAAQGTHVNVDTQSVSGLSNIPLGQSSTPILPGSPSRQCVNQVASESPEGTLATQDGPLSPSMEHPSSRTFETVSNEDPRCSQNATGTDKPQNIKKAKRVVKKRDSLKQWGGALKRGCLASFSVKRLFLLPHIAEITIFQSRHENAEGVQCHGLSITGDRGAFSWHLSNDIKAFVLKLLRDGHSVPQIMAKHMQVVQEALRNGNDISRDMFLHERDVRNLATKVARETYMLDTNDGKSVQLWVQVNQDSVFFYQETGQVGAGVLTPSNIPFTIGIQTPWQKEVMLQFGHEGGVSIDATFGTNENKYPLYTIMVFDEWHNGIPVGFVLTSRSAQEDLTPWMTALDNTLKQRNSNWKPNAFIVDCAQGEINSLRQVWPSTSIFLCLWHVHRAWQKQACIKIQDCTVRANILKGLSSIMYDRLGPSGDGASTWAIQRLEILRLQNPGENEFWEYIREYWVPKVHMWVVGFRNLPHAGQDTNAAVESYHGYMKSVLKAERSRMTGRRMDWCIHVLTGDILTHYWYHRIRKEFGFVDNRKERGIVISALIQARDIPDTDVTLPLVEGGPAYVTSTTNRHIRYTVHNPAELCATCNCEHFQRGNTCKHKVKVLRLLHPRLAEGTIARHCGSLKGTSGAGKGLLLTPQRQSEAQTMEHNNVETPQTMDTSTSTENTETVTSHQNREQLPTVLRAQTEDLLQTVLGNETLMLHAHAELHRLTGKMKKLATDLEAGRMHPYQSNPVFSPVQDGLPFSLARMKDWLERGGRPAASRRLHLGSQPL